MKINEDGKRKDNNMTDDAINFFLFCRGCLRRALARGSQIKTGADGLLNLYGQPGDNAGSALQ